MGRRATAWTRRIPVSGALFAGLVALFVLTRLTEGATGNSKLLPELIALGALAVPVAFVALVRELLPGAPVSTRTIVACFVGGGVIGTVAATLLEYHAVDRLGLPHALAVGVLEEPAKLLIPLVAFAVAARRGTAYGLIVGVAAGMGFAAFETMGYAIDAVAGSPARLDSVVTRPSGAVDAAEDTLVLRGVLASSGHPAWTGLVCAALWWSAGRRRATRVAMLAAPAALLAAVALHGAWDGFEARPAQMAVATASVLLFGSWMLVARRELQGVRPQI